MFSKGSHIEGPASDKLNAALSDDEVQSSSEASEHDSEENCIDVSEAGLEALVGMRLKTSFGPGAIEETREFEDMRYFSVRLDTFGTVSLPQGVVEVLLRKEGKLGPRQGIAPLRSQASRFQNLRGFIRMYNPAKGWGFLVCNEFDGDVFLHSKHMLGNLPREYIGHFQSSQDGHVVRFDLDLQHKKRPQALNVRVVTLAEQEVAVYPKKRAARSVLSKAMAMADDEGRLEGAFNDSEQKIAEVEPPDPWAAAAAAKHADFQRKSPPSNSGLAAGSSGTVEDGGEPAWAHCVSLPDAEEDDVVDLISEADVSLPEKEQLHAPLSENLWSQDLVEKAKRKGMLRMRGLPFTVTVAEVVDFFEGYGVRPDDVTLGQRLDGSPSGEACVLFVRDELAEKARKERHMSHMGKRYIELFNTRLLHDGVEVEEASGYLPTMSNSSIARSSSAVSAGASPPPGAVAQAPVRSFTAEATALYNEASAHAAHAAAMHTQHNAQRPMAGLPSVPELPFAHSGGPAPADAQMAQQQAYQQYYQYFQQAYAAAVASQAVQAYAHTAAQHYQQTAAPAAPAYPATSQMSARPQLDRSRGGTSATPPFEYPVGDNSELAAAAAAAIATPTTAAPTGVQAPVGQAGHTADQSIWPSAQEYAESAPKAQEADQEQQEADQEQQEPVPWQHYNVI